MRTAIAILAAVTFTAVAAAPAVAADDARVNAATNRVETGAKKIGEGVAETARGIGKTVEEGAKYTGEKLKESGKTAAPEAKSFGRNVRDGAASFGHSVKTFFTRLFSND